MLWPDQLLHPLPDELSDDAGALLEPLGVAIHASGLAHVRPGSDVLVIGAGPIGILAVQVARQSGAARLFVVEPLEHRRMAALRSGADSAWPAEHGVEELLDATGGRGADAVIEMAGTDAAIATAVAASRPGGRVALGGIPSQDLSAFPAAAARRKGLTFAMVRRMNDTYGRAIALATTAIDLDALVT
jgi:L-iditol 2-dehydrogenase